MSSLVRHISANYAGHLVAVAAFESVVEVWDVTSLSRISHFNTILDFGGRRLCLQERDEVVAVGSYGSRRLAGHETSTGDRIWEVKVPHPVQRISCDPTNSDFLAVLEDGPLMRFDSSSGKLIREYPGVKSITVGPSNPDYCLQEFTQDYGVCARASGKLLTKLKRSAPILLAAELSQREVFLSEFDGGLTSFNLESGAPRWHCIPINGWQYVNLAYSVTTGKLFAVRRNPNERGPTFIDSLDAVSGEVSDSVLIQGPALCTAFAVRNSTLITAGGNLYALQDNSSSFGLTSDIPFLVDS